MEKDRTAIVIGATGLIGSSLVINLLNEDSYNKIQVFSRRPLDVLNDKIQVNTVDFDRLHVSKGLIKAQDAFCCLGTTMKMAGSKEAFYKVDFTYVHEFAKICQDQGVERFFLVTALGANANSLFYYNKVKGEIEQAIEKLPFKAVHIFRPSLLLGNRKEKRFGEDLAKTFNTVFQPFIPKKYQGIEGNLVASAMIKAANTNQEGIHYHLSKEIREEVES
ncbi:MAG: NAD(P)H-binding protein [Flammeovirgaceae bacterium]|nr:NAD(P)H-binding protein [Flammeovirgaceae bacterium]